MTEQPAEKRVETVAVDSLGPDPDNARIHGTGLGLRRLSLDPGRRRSAMYKPGRRERQKRRCCSSNLNSGNTPSSPYGPVAISMMRHGPSAVSRATITHSVACPLSRAAASCAW